MKVARTWSGIFRGFMRALGGWAFWNTRVFCGGFSSGLLKGKAFLKSGLRMYDLRFIRLRV